MLQSAGVGDLKYQRTVIGYHGCDESVVKDVLLRGRTLRPSENDYDWLGRGIYFWEHGPRRAYEWAQHSMKTCSWAREHYDLQRSRNKSHHAAVRSLAFKWLRILFRCWKNREPYNEARYEESLRRHAPKAEENAKKTTLDLQWKSCGGFSKLV